MTRSSFRVLFLVALLLACGGEEVGDEFPLIRPYVGVLVGGQITDANGQPSEGASVAVIPYYRGRDEAVNACRDGPGYVAFDRSDERGRYAVRTQTDLAPDVADSACLVILVTPPGGGEEDMLLRVIPAVPLQSWTSETSDTTVVDFALQPRGARAIR